MSHGGADMRGVAEAHCDGLALMAIVMLRQCGALSVQAPRCPPFRSSAPACAGSGGDTRSAELCRSGVAGGMAVHFAWQRYLLAGVSITLHTGAALAQLEAC